MCVGPKSNVELAIGEMSSVVYFITKRKAVPSAGCDYEKITGQTTATRKLYMTQSVMLDVGKHRLRSGADATPLLPEVGRASPATP